jgi:hypothetical protein
MNPADDTSNDHIDDAPLDEHARLTRLVMHVGRLVSRGGTVEEQQGFRAIVSMPNRQQMVPNVIMAAIGVAMFVWLGDALFLVGAGVALLGWHRKLVAGAERVKVLVRVDDLGRVTERKLETA